MFMLFSLEVFKTSRITIMREGALFFLQKISSAVRGKTGLEKTPDKFSEHSQLKNRILPLLSS